MKLEGAIQKHLTTPEARPGRDPVRSSRPAELPAGNEKPPKRTSGISYDRERPPSLQGPASVTRSILLPLDGSAQDAASRFSANTRAINFYAITAGLTSQGGDGELIGVDTYA